MIIESVTIANYCTFGKNNNALRMSSGETTIVSMKEFRKKQLVAFKRVYRFGKWNSHKYCATFRDRTSNNPIRIPVNLAETADGAPDIAENNVHGINVIAIDLYDRNLPYRQRNG